MMVRVIQNGPVDFLIKNLVQLLPFSSFSSYWDEKTGKTVIECSEDDPEYCPTLASLRNIETISLWGEGVEGKVALDVRNLKAVGCRNGKYANKLASLGVVDDGHSGHTYAFDMATFLPGMILTAVLLALLVMLRKRNDNRSKKSGLYGEVPPISSDAEVNVLRSEVVEMKNVISTLRGDAGSSSSTFV